MATGRDFLTSARKHRGERYVFGAAVPKDHPTYTGPWDCAEFVSWVTYQVTGTLYGCADNTCAPSAADAYTGFWDRDARQQQLRISVEDAAATPGAMVLRVPLPGVIGHIVFSDGAGGTIEAHSTKRGVIESTLSGRRWDYGIKLADVDYTRSADVPVAPVKGPVYRVTDPVMEGPVVRRIQRALKARGFSPGPPDGKYGPHTAAAVASFQAQRGLVVDGEVGSKTAKALGVALV